ncbi:MAG: D-alanyl-D-alanine carboxypeptidase family protein [Trichloromonadaceae bacterium]
MSRTLLCLLLLLLSIAPAIAGNPFAGAAAAYLVKAPDTPGNPDWAQQADRRLPPASLTKVMTALIVLETTSPAAVVTIDRQAAAETGSRLKLQVGDSFLVRDLLAATLIRSANDAAHALAVHVAGSEAAFARKMTQRAAKLGLRNSHFVNASGLDHPQHYSSANDLARIAQEALKHPMFRDLVGTAQSAIKPLNRDQTYPLETSNKLLTKYEGMLGVKTGYTSKAGRCLIALAERDGQQVMLVLLNAPQRWESAAAMLDRAFAQKTSHLGPYPVNQ